MTGLVTHMLRSSSLVGCEVVCVLSEKREEAFPRTQSLSESDIEACMLRGSGVKEMRKCNFVKTQTYTAEPLIITGIRNLR